MQVFKAVQLSARETSVLERVVQAFQRAYCSHRETFAASRGVADFNRVGRSVENHAVSAGNASASCGRNMQRAFIWPLVERVRLDFRFLEVFAKIRRAISNAVPLGLSAFWL